MHVFFVINFTVTNKVGNHTATQGPEGVGRIWCSDSRRVPRTKGQTVKRNVKSLNIKSFIKAIDCIRAIYVFMHAYSACLI